MWKGTDRISAPGSTINSSVVYVDVYVCVCVCVCVCVYELNLFFPVSPRPNAGFASSFLRFLDRTQGRTAVVGLLWTSDQLDTHSAHNKPIPTARFGEPESIRTSMP